MDRFWPMDEQTCTLKFGSWTSHGNEISLDLYRNMKHIELLNFYSNNGEWRITKTTVDAKSITYSCCPEVQYIHL